MTKNMISQDTASKNMKTAAAVAFLLGTTSMASAEVSSDTYIKDHVTWTLHSGKVQEEIYLEDGQEIDSSITSIIVPREERTAGYDSNRINSIIPFINIKENKDYGRFGATLGGFHPYRSEDRQSTGFFPAIEGVRTLKMHDYLPLYKDIALVDEVPLSELDAINKLRADATIYSKNGGQFLLTELAVLNERNDFKTWGRSYPAQRCDLEATLNGEPVDLNRSDEFYAIVSLEPGDNAFATEVYCYPEYAHGSQHRRVNEGGYAYRGSYGYDDGFTIKGLTFRFVDASTEQEIGFGMTEDPASSTSPKPSAEIDDTLPTLHVWRNIGKDDFVASSDLEFTLDGGNGKVWSKLEEFDFTDIELINQKLQKYSFEDKTHSNRIMVKGTFYPKNKGVFEVLVMKRSNIKGSQHHDENFFMQPVYSLAMDYGKPVAHSKKRDTSVSDIPLEYDWFFFDATDDHVNFGMDMSFYAKGVIGDTHKKAQKTIVKMTSQGGIELDHDVALTKGITASQRMAIYIKAPNEEVFRPLNHSDFYSGDYAPAPEQELVAGTDREVIEVEVPETQGLGDLDAFAFE